MKKVIIQNLRLGTESSMITLDPDSYIQANKESFGKESYLKEEINCSPEEKLLPSQMVTKQILVNNVLEDVQVKHYVIPATYTIQIIDLPVGYDYAEKRAKEYPYIGDQLDALYKARLGNNTELQQIDAKIAEVKARYPKP